MANVPFSTSIYGKRLADSLGGQSRLTIGTLGESHAEVYIRGAIGYALERYFHADVIFDYRTYASGGQMFAVGATTINGANGLVAQLPNFAARPSDIAFVGAGWNDVLGADSPETIVANLSSAINTLFSTGARHVVLLGMTPYNVATSTSAHKFNRTDKLIRALCDTTPYLHYVDPFSTLGSPTLTANPWSYRNSVAPGAGTSDGTHWNSHGGRLMAPQIADILRRIGVPERVARLMPSLGIYNPSTNPYANMIGDTGNMLGTAGFYSGGGTVAGTATQDRLIVTVAGGVTITPSIVTAADGERKQRFTLGGVGGANTNIAVTFAQDQATNNGDTTRRMDFEATVELTGVTGLTDMFIRCTAGSAYNSPSMMSSDAKNEDSAARTETLLLRTTYPIPVPATGSPASFTFNALFTADAARPVAGTIDISRVSAALI